MIRLCTVNCFVLKFLGVNLWHGMRAGTSASTLKLTQALSLPQVMYPKVCQGIKEQQPTALSLVDIKQVSKKKKKSKSLFIHRRSETISVSVMISEC